MSFPCAGGLALVGRAVFLIKLITYSAFGRWQAFTDANSRQPDVHRNSRTSISRRVLQCFKEAATRGAADQR
ncbi:hypothetical protein BK025_09435 [Sodalis sp. TME1]|nr:hypothetical protein BK025_09435 [Sodalis sp. TME1]